MRSCVQTLCMCSFNRVHILSDSLYVFLQQGALSFRPAVCVPVFRLSVLCIPVCVQIPISKWLQQEAEAEALRAAQAAAAAAAAEKIFSDDEEDAGLRMEMSDDGGTRQGGESHLHV